MPRSREILLPWDSQPQESVEVNPAHPLASQVIDFWIASSPNASNGVVLTSSGTNNQVNQNARAVNFGSYAGTGIINLPNNNRSRLVGIDASIVSGVTFGTVASNQFEYLWALRDGSTTRGLLFLGNDPTTYFGGRVALNSAGVDLVGTSGSIKQNQYATYGCTFASSGRSLYVNGALDTADAVSGRIAASTIQPALGNRQTGGRALENGALHFCFTFEGDIGAAWHKSLADDPYQLVEFQTIPVPVSAGGGGATNLIIQEALHSHTADNIGLTLDTFLSVQEALHAHTAVNLTLSTTGSTDLTLQDASHAHTADNLALTLDTFLLLQDALHAHAADNITLSTGAVADLVIQEALHAHTADALVLTLDTFLVIQEAAHAHGADNIAFTMDSLLAVQESLHGHLADNVILTIPAGALSDAEFRQMYDWISELHLVHGLRAGSPLTVTPTTRAAGIVDQTIGEVGTTVTVTRI